MVGFGNKKYPFNFSSIIDVALFRHLGYIGCNSFGGMTTHMKHVHNGNCDGGTSSKQLSHDIFAFCASFLTLDCSLVAAINSKNLLPHTVCISSRARALGPRW